MNIEFSNILTIAVAPIVLISGTGLILLSIVNRYGLAISRVRALITERRKSDERRAECLTKQIGVIVKRCNYLRLSIAAIVVSVILSSFIILGSIIAVTKGYNLTSLLTVFLLLDCLCIVIANVLLLTDVTFSMEALEIEINSDAECHA